MTKRILLTGAGGPAAIGAMKSVSSDDLLFYAGDMDPNAAGLYLVPIARRTLLLPASHPRFVDNLLKQCVEHRIDVLWPTVDAEFLPLAMRRHEFEDRGIQLLLPRLGTLQLCLDKWRLYRACRHSVPCPETWVYNPSDARRDCRGPVVLKPRSGSGGRGIRYIPGPAEVAEVGELDAYLMQETLPGDEYSVDVFVSNDRLTHAAVPRIRSKVDSGIAVTSETLHDPELEALALTVANRVGLTGAANIQFRRDSRGQARLLEVNPRVAGTMVLSVQAGINLPQLALDDLLGKPLPDRLEFKELGVVRMHQEVYIDRSELALMRSCHAERSHQEVASCAPNSAA